MTGGPDATALGPVAAAHLPALLYALEVCALQMTEAAREEDAAYYRAVARALAAAAGGSAGQ